jgi:hypothetical protein
MQRTGKYKGIQLPDSESLEIPTLVTVEGMLFYLQRKLD